MPESDAGKHWYNPFDLTKVWPHEDYPLIEVGILELNRNPENYFAEVEQAAFSPSNIVPGIGHSPDKMLQARIFSYADAHRYRVGINYDQLPVNKPRCPVHHYHADGAMRLAGHANPDAYYEPNTFGGPAQDERFREPPLAISGDADRYNHRDGNDDYRQPGDLFRLMTPDQKDQLFHNIAGGDGGRAGRDRQAPDRALLPRRSGLRHRRRHPHGPLGRRPAARRRSRVKEQAMSANVKVRELVVAAEEAALNEALAENHVEPEKIISVMLQPGQHMAIGDHGPKYRVVYRP